ncbi:MAG: bactofilin family protein, partial [Candidatus Adiutrix sp.]
RCLKMFKSAKTKNPGYSYFASRVTLEGRLCFSGITRLDGRVRGEIISTGTLIVEETAIIKGDICVESVVLSGTVYGNIKASKQVHLNSTANLFGDTHYGALSIDEGAVHEGSSHKLTPEEVNEVQSICSSAVENNNIHEDSWQGKNDKPLIAPVRYIAGKSHTLSTVDDSQHNPYHNDGHPAPSKLSKSKKDELKIDESSSNEPSPDEQLNHKSSQATA